MDLVELIPKILLIKMVTDKAERYQKFINGVGIDHNTL